MSVIFNEPGGGQTLSNPSQQNNVFQFVQTTKPTERSAGVALVAGDRWYKNDDGTSWFWNGTYWLGEQLEISPPQLTNITTSSIASHGTINTVGSVLVDRVVCYTLVSVTNDTNNYWTLAVALARVQDIGTTIASFSTANDAANGRLGKQAIVNYVYNSSFPNNSGAHLRLEWTKVGSPGYFYAGVSLRYRHIAP
jgi:hypothetical protein